MSAGWVAGSVRARALARRRLGAEETRRLASCGSLSDALRMLAATAYGAGLRPGQPLAVAQREIASSVLWDLRVLAGWLPSEGLRLLRVLGAWFELANIDELLQSIAGSAINPVLREPPAEPVLTGISVIDSLTTLVRGQKLPVFSVAGLPHLELAAQLAAQASVGGDPFSVVFAAMGLTHADAAAVRGVLEERSAAGELVLLLDLADAPVIERILTPRLALTVAEHLAFTLGRHVLVVMADMTSYCEALREFSAARGESRPGAPIPGTCTATSPRCTNAAAVSAGCRARSRWCRC